MSDTVLIASPDLLGPLSSDAELSAALTFPDSDAQAALDAIIRRRPRLVAIEKLFASTARGAALIDRIRTDPALSGCEVRIVSHDPAQAAAPGEAVVAAPEARRPAAAPDEHDRRGVPRFEMPEPLAVVLDGHPARLIDLAVAGAQVSTVLAMKPGQRVRLALPATPRPVRLSGVVQWASFEMPAEGPRYRAGLRFLDADPQVVTAFIDAHRVA